MDIDPALAPLMRSDSEETMNVIVCVRVGGTGLKPALEGAGLIVTGSSDFGSEVFFYGRICVRDLGNLTGIQEIDSIVPDTEQRMM